MWLDNSYIHMNLNFKKHNKSTLFINIVRINKPVYSFMPKNNKQKIKKSVFIYQAD